jgi:hypothetical protein
MDSPDTKARRNLTLPELTHSHALKPWDSAVTRRLGASARVLPSWVLLYAPVSETAPSLFCLKLSGSVVLLVQRTALKLLPTGRLACGTSVSLLKETVHQPVVNLERIASRFILPIKRWAFSVFALSLRDALSLIPIPERNLLTLAPSPNLEFHI